MAKRVLVTGATGQDGSNLIDYLLENTEVEVYGGVRRLSVPNHKNLKKAIENPRFHIVDFDITDSVSVHETIANIIPDWIVNFAAMSFVGLSWKNPELCFSTNTMGIMRILEAVRKINPSCRVYSAGSSEEFGNVIYSPQDENHPIRPRSPYAASKAAAGNIVKVWRESYGLFAIHGHLFNHEGIRRGEEFITRKITKNLARIKKQLQKGQIPEPLIIGNIHAKRDWSDSEDFVVGIWMMMQMDKPEDFVLSSNETHSVKEFIDLACRYAGFEDIENSSQSFDAHYKTHDKQIYLEWNIDDVNVENTQLCLVYYGIRIPIVKVSKEFFRPAEVDLLWGDSTKARTMLGWKPKTTFDGLVQKMVLHDMQ
jgi:GDPmannose 4,6-dehydratase